MFTTGLVWRARSDFRSPEVGISVQSIIRANIHERDKLDTVQGNMGCLCRAVSSPFQPLVHMVATWRILCRKRKFCSVLQLSSLFWFWILAKMVRHRKGKHALDSSKDHDDRSKFTRRRGKQPSLKPFLLLAAVFGIPLCIFGAFKLWNYRLYSRLYTPLNAPLVINKSESDMSRFWGTYRSNLYFGLR